MSGNTPSCDNPVRFVCKFVLGGAVPQEPFHIVSNNPVCWFSALVCIWIHHAKNKCEKFGFMTDFQHRCTLVFVCCSIFEMACDAQDLRCKWFHGLGPGFGIVAMFFGGHFFRLKKNVCFVWMILSRSFSKKMMVGLSQKIKSLNTPTFEQTVKQLDFHRAQFT